MSFDFVSEAKLDFQCNGFLSREELVMHRDCYMQKESMGLKVFCDGFDKNTPEVLYRLRPFALPPYRRALFEDMRNDAGGYISHRAFFNSIGERSVPPKEVVSRLRPKYKSFDGFCYEFVRCAAATNLPGFLWIGEDLFKKKELKIIFAPQNKLPVDFRGILCLDLWEHSYCCTYKDRRDLYAADFLKVCRWDKLCEG